jgi:hypothetical protein
MRCNAKGGGAKSSPPFPCPSSGRVVSSWRMRSSSDCVSSLLPKRLNPIHHFGDEPNEPSAELNILNASEGLSQRDAVATGQEFSYIILCARRSIF